MKKPVLLIVLDGWGHRDEKTYNAIYEANTPYFDFLWRNYPHATLKASGEAVGLPEGQMGNSEVGHITIGAGKTIDTDLVKIGNAALNDLMKENPVFIELFEHIKKYDSTLHLLGLIGPGGVHAHDNHLLGIIKAAKHHGIEKIAIHAFTDGRDTPPKSAASFLKNLEEEIAKIGIGFIASASGRFYAMDRDKNWDRVKKAEDVIFHGQATRKESRKASEVMEEMYEHDIVDEMLEPVVFVDENQKYYKVEENDGILFFNFRADRSRQLSYKIVERKKDLNLYFATLTQYDPSIDSKVAYMPEAIETTLANEVSKADLAQVHIAETEKFAHATYYLNGGRQDPHHKEEHILIDSRKDIDTHDKAPEMRAVEISETAVQYLDQKIPFIFINFANADMVGHTGQKEAIIKAVETVDAALKTTIKCAIENDYIIFVTADHGNAELYVDENNQPHTAHTTNEVPAILIGSNHSIQGGTLADIAPTMLELLEIAKPSAMTGRSLLLK